MRRTASVALFVLGLALAPGAAAQSSRSAVPEELVRALLGGGAVTVGRLPEGVPPQVLPSDRAQVLGGVTYPRRSTAIVIVPSAPEDALAAYRSRMERAPGWRLRRETSSEPQRGGFVSTPATQRSFVLCGEDDAALTAYAAPRSEGGSFLRINVDRESPSAYCGPGREAAPPQTADDVPFPALQAPEGVSMRSTGSGSMSGMSGVEERSSSAQLDTSLSPSDLVAHFGEQLRAAGWTVGAPAATESAAVLTADLQDPQRRSWRAVLTVFTRSGSAREASLRVIRRPPTE